jgi:molybdate transport system substrate-binding protein
VKRVLTACAALLLLVVAGCSSSTKQDSGADVISNAPTNSTPAKLSGSITVDAAASLTEAFGTIIKQFQAAHPGTKITAKYGASSDLSTQITQGDAVDVFASASTKNMDSVVSSGDASSPTNFVSNTLEIAVPPSNPAKITKLADLAKSGVKVAACAPAVPCGVVAAKVFSNAKLKITPAANEQDVKSTLAIVESGDVDAGLVYVTDVRSAGDKVKGIEIPDDVNASTTYPISTLTKSKNPALAAAFVDYVLSPAGQKVLAADGFSQP